MSTIIPCHQLAEPPLIARVASIMTPEGMVGEPPFQIHPGICRLCGCALPIGWRMTRFNEASGEFEMVEYAADDPRAKSLENLNRPGYRLGPGIVLTYPKGARADGWPSVVVAAVTCCDNLSAELFRKATLVVREKAAKARRDQLNRAAGFQLANDRARKAAAAAIARNINAANPQTPSPDDGSF